jgi:hypothetical protein
MGICLGLELVLAGLVEASTGAKLGIAHSGFGDWGIEEVVKSVIHNPE